MSGGSGAAGERGRSLEGRNALITGGSGGIGSATAWRLAGDGAAVLIAARDAEEVERTAHALRTGGRQVLGTVCDVTSEAEVEVLRDTARADLGAIDILVNCAGAATSAPLERLTLEDWNRMHQVNATGVFLCTRAFAPEMARRGWGRVITIASVAGVAGARYIAAYAAAKHAAVGFTRCIAAELANRGVTVNAICPGYVDTEMTEATLDNIARHTGMNRDQALDALLATLPQHRLIDPEEVAHLVAMLCADDAGGMNGQALVLDGGQWSG